MVMAAMVPVPAAAVTTASVDARGHHGQGQQDQGEFREQFHQKPPLKE
jgi:hypothetical protein